MESAPPHVALQIRDRTVASYLTRLATSTGGPNVSLWSTSPLASRASAVSSVRLLCNLLRLRPCGVGLLAIASCARGCTLLVSGHRGRSSTHSSSSHSRRHLSADSWSWSGSLSPAPSPASPHAVPPEETLSGEPSRSAAPAALGATQGCGCVAGDETCWAELCASSTAAVDGAVTCGGTPQSPLPIKRPERLLSLMLRGRMLVQHSTGQRTLAALYDCNSLPV